MDEAIPDEDLNMLDMTQIDNRAAESLAVATLENSSADTEETTTATENMADNLDSIVARLLLETMLETRANDS